MHYDHIHTGTVASLLRVDSRDGFWVVCMCLILSGCLAIQTAWRLPLLFLGIFIDGLFEYVHWSPRRMVGPIVAYSKATYFAPEAS